MVLCIICSIVVVYKSWRTCRRKINFDTKSKMSKRTEVFPHYHYLCFAFIYVVVVLLIWNQWKIQRKLAFLHNSQRLCGLTRNFHNSRYICVCVTVGVYLTKKILIFSLELNTNARTHSICAISSYVFCWIITSDTLLRTCSWFCFRLSFH